MQAATKVTTRSTTAPSGVPVVVLAFSGDISSSSKDAILGAYNALASDISRVLLDFSGVEYINSSGIAIIIQLLMEASKSGSRVIGIYGLTPHFQKVFTMVGIAKYAKMSADEGGALAEL